MEAPGIHASSRSIITDSLSFNIFHRDDAFRTGTDGKHIQLALFLAPEHLKETTLKLLRAFLKQSGSKSVIGLAENDPSLTVLAAQASSRENTPYYNYGPGAEFPFGQLAGPAKAPRTLMIPYSVSQSHVLETVGMFSQHKVRISQVIAVVDENPPKRAFAGQDFEFVSVSDWESLRERIGRFQNVTAEKMDRVLSNLR